MPDPSAHTPARNIDADKRTAGISVIIPTCDRPRSLMEAIESVHDQTLRPLEIIVVDNGCTEVTTLPPCEILTRIRMAPRVGVSRARNHGASQASGEFLAFLDDDDLWHPEFLERMYSKAQESGNPIVYGGKYTLDDEGLIPYKIPAATDLTEKVLLRRNPGTGGQNLLVRKKTFFEIGGFDENLKMGEDASFALDAILSGHAIATEGGAVSIIRHHDGPRLRTNPSPRIAFIRKYRRYFVLAEYAIRWTFIMLWAATHRMRPVLGDFPETALWWLKNRIQPTKRRSARPRSGDENEGR